LLVNAVQQSNLSKKDKNMTTLHLGKSIGWSPLRLAFLLIPLVLTIQSQSFAFSLMELAVVEATIAHDVVSNLTTSTGAPRPLSSGTATLNLNTA
jgi:nitric oxide synthase oxygenase domain/subunit